jgi:hypothetical protein
MSSSSISRSTPPPSDLTVDFDKGLTLGNGAANADLWKPAPRPPEVQRPVTERISITSLVVCLGILAWAVVSAYLSQL